MAMMVTPVAAKEQTVDPTPTSGGVVILTFSWQTQPVSGMNAQLAHVPGNRVQLELGRNLVVVAYVAPTNWLPDLVTYGDGEAGMVMLSTNGAVNQNFTGGSLSLYSPVTISAGTIQAKQFTTGALSANADSPMSLRFSFSATSIGDQHFKSVELSPGVNFVATG
jgi:hypothetical protein